MALRVNDILITKVVFNDTEQKALRYNGVGYFGKCYSLTQNSSTGVSIDIAHDSSPY